MIYYFIHTFMYTVKYSNAVCIQLENVRLICSMFHILFIKLNYNN